MRGMRNQERSARHNGAQSPHRISCNKRIRRQRDIEIHRMATHHRSGQEAHCERARYAYLGKLHKHGQCIDANNWRCVLPWRLSHVHRQSWIRLDGHGKVSITNNIDSYTNHSLHHLSNIQYVSSRCNKKYSTIRWHCL